tara:strand:+ start:4945 stop:5271 length:327 start_codon:yes stop_codon:yes gene_type:complete
MNHLDDIMTAITILKEAGQADSYIRNCPEHRELRELLINMWHSVEAKQSNGGNEYDTANRFESHAEIIGEQLRRERQFQIEADYEETEAKYNLTYGANIEAHGDDIPF